MSTNYSIHSAHSVEKVEVHTAASVNGYWITITIEAINWDKSTDSHLINIFTEDESGDFASQFLTKLRCAVNNFEIGKELDDSWQSEINPEPIL
jgi:hypothetical protein